MAIMWPRTLPTWVTQDSRRSAEIRVFSALEREFFDDWSVYYSRPWWGLSKTGGEIDGEADFIIAHPVHGVLFIEVKGGLIGFDPITGQWTSKDRNGVRHRIKDPVLQAQKSKYILLKKFQSRPSWPKTRVVMRHGVIFTDCNSSDQFFIAGYDEGLFCFATPFRDSIFDWVFSRLSAVDAGEIGPGLLGMSVINEIIAVPARLKVPLFRELQSDIDQQDSLMTGAQIQAIAFIETSRRVVVEGGAGTGKTVLACELALRGAERGLSVLLCCVSFPLAVALRNKTMFVDSVDVRTIDDCMLESCQGDVSVYDLIIVDEGQDVDWSIWGVIEKRLSKSGALRVFFDSNQAIYRARQDLETKLSCQGISLLVNLRNTKTISSVTEFLYRGPLIQCVGPNGRAVEHIPGLQYSDIAVCRLIDLLNIDEILPKDIVILSEDGLIRSSLSAALGSRGIKSTSAHVRDSAAVVVDSIVNFKGLEALVVVLVADRITANNHELAYVAVSRARALLIVVGDIDGTALFGALESAKR